MSEASEVLTWEFMVPKGWRADNLAEATGLPLTTCRELANGSIPIDEHAAKKLAIAFGNSVEFWINLEANASKKSGKYYDPLYRDFEEFKKLMVETRSNLERMNTAQNHMHWQTNDDDFNTQLAALQKELDDALNGWVSSHCG